MRRLALVVGLLAAACLRAWLLQDETDEVLELR